MKAQGLTQGLLNLPGSNSETKALVEKLLTDDEEKHHCFWGKVGFHNHLPHHILAVYDLAAPAKVLQAIYDEEAKSQAPINLVDRKEQKVGTVDLTITQENWTEHVGPEKNYIAFLKFFESEVDRIGVADCLDQYVFSPRANGNNTSMLARAVGGAVHPLIQVGYGVEFNLPSLVASGLAQTAVTNPTSSSLFQGLDKSPSASVDSSPSLLSIIQKVYDSDTLKPVLPYDPDALLSKRIRDALGDGRPEEISRVSSLWYVDPQGNQEDLDKRIEEIIWAATLLTFSTGKHGRKPRLDFFLMHLLTSSLFLPSLVRAIKSPEHKSRLLRAFVPVMLFYVLLRGRPRIDTSLIMSYTPFPAPPKVSTPGSEPAPHESTLGNPRDPASVNPWPALVASVIYTPDAHIVKSMRTLYYAAQKFGETPAGGVIGAVDHSGKETLKGSSKLDGTIFVRAAGVMMDTLGWVSHGQKEESWDRSALGWDAAWDAPDQ